MIRLNHQIRFKSSIKHHTEYLNNDRIRNFVVKSEIRFLIINIRIIFLIREFFDILSILLTNRSFFSIHSINFIFRLEIFEFFHNISSNNQHWSHFSYLKIDHKTYLLIITNRHFFFVAEIISIIESKNQSIFRQNFQYWQSHIDIWVIFDFWKFSKITFVDSANQSRFFNICDEIDNIFYIFVQYYDKNSVLRLFNFVENIKKSYLFH